MKVKSVVKVSTVYYYIETDDELFPQYRRSLGRQWEHSVGKSWEEWHDDGALEKAFEEYIAGLPPMPPTFRLEYELPRTSPEDTSLEDGVYYIEYIDASHVSLTKKASS